MCAQGAAPRVRRPARAGAQPLEGGLGVDRVATGPVPRAGPQEPVRFAFRVAVRGQPAQVDTRGVGRVRERDVAGRAPVRAQGPQEAQHPGAAEARRQPRQAPAQFLQLVAVARERLQVAFPSLFQAAGQPHQAVGGRLGLAQAGRRQGFDRALRTRCQQRPGAAAERGLEPGEGPGELSFRLALRQQARGQQPTGPAIGFGQIQPELAAGVSAQRFQGAQALRPCYKRRPFRSILQPEAPPMTRAYSISADSIAAERKRVDDDLSKIDSARVVQLDELELPEPGPDDVKLRILAVSCEHNVDHAAIADTVNIAEARGGKIYPGNSAMGEVVAVGERVTKFKPGDVVITHCNGEPDDHGYPLRIWAYDQPESRGWYAEEAVVGAWQLIHAPLDSGLNLWEIAALPLRAPTAYHMWRRALGIYRVKVPREQKSRLTVLGFGGGVSELFLMLAHHEGHRAIFCSGTADRRAHLEKLGIESIDQKAYNRFAGRDDVKAFSKEVKKLTGGEGANIVCDMLRGPVYAAGLAVLSRMGVNVSAGWQLDTACNYNSANLSVRQITVDHVHYETVPGCAAATELYGRVFRPTVHREIYKFEDLPRAISEMHHNVQTGIPIVQVAAELPDSVRHLVP